MSLVLAGAGPALGLEWQLAREGMAPLHAAAASPTTYVMAGEFGDIWTSADGATWTRAQTPPGATMTLRGAVYGGGRFVLVGDTRCCTGADRSALVLTSTDANSWTLVSSAPAGNNQNLRAVAFGNALYVAVGSGGVILTSPNATTWTARTSGTTQNLKGVAFGGGAFVAVGDNKTVLLSADGINWAPQTVPGSVPPLVSALEDITYTGTQFVLVGERGTILRSPNGSTWTDHTLLAPNNTAPLAAVASGNGMIVAGDALRVWSSPDGITWTARSLSWGGGEANPMIATLVYGAAGGGAFVGSTYNPGFGEGGDIHRSANGTTWASHTLPASRNLAAAVFGNGVFCAVGSSGSVASSVDGITWTNRASLVPNNSNNPVFWRSIVRSSVSGNFVAVGGGFGGDIMTSPDCIIWTNRSTGGAVGYAGVVEGVGGILVAVGARSPDSLSPQNQPVIATSINGGANWTVGDQPGLGFIQKVAFKPASEGGPLFVALGGLGGGALLEYTSTNGTAWTPVTPVGLAPPYSTFGDFTHGNGRFLVVNGANLWISTDGVNWTPQGGATSAYGAIYAASKYMTVGVGGNNFVSLDAQKWVGSNPASGHNQSGIAYSPGLDRVVAVGASVATYAAGTPAQADLPRFRLYHKGTNEHFYTTSVVEYNALPASGWDQEGETHQAFQNDGLFAATLPVALYRLYHPGIAQHLWTTAKFEYDQLALQGWIPEGIDRYISEIPGPGTLPLYRLAHKSLPLHLWTTSTLEYDTLGAGDWNKEGVVGHVR